MKSHSSFVCQQCGYKSPSFLGKCPECGSWNSMVETVEKEDSPAWSKKNKRDKKSNNQAVKLTSVLTTKVNRVSTGIKEVDQVLGGGLVPGSLILLAGDPGIGKSTLTLQLIAYIEGLYVSGEESAAQIKLRAQRLKLKTEKILILSETNVESMLEEAISNKNNINLLIIDSIQTLWSEELSGAPGAIGQVRESTLKLMDFAKKEHIAVILIGHVTKEGTIAGPKTLEHIVDTVLYLEGERFQTLRLLRTSKNRFGPVDEVGVFSMEETGMREVDNPSELFLGKSNDPGSQSNNDPGSVIIATLEGSRPLLVEVQALTVSTQIPIPRRVGNGINNNRLQMLVAIIQKHLRLPLGNFDIFVNVASGIKVFEPAADLGICLAIISSFKNKSLSPKTVAIGEVGLLGEIRNVIGLDRRIKEARKLGFTNILSPKTYSSLTKTVNTLF
ncbi:DNA repair protein RadA [Candidatus Gottesmanbacteria bacterium RIFCSPHIGHO2_02_FULL_40_13]|uniref:DNA repair protein RadA n=1 Tax=Candidatus Gottesmanbacteria bacterium RIFCSPHIGHO2_02_FULL_40_13 TaxID=1798384 RepID=A0A1F6A7Q8_9BACT|nr:MAG: DNA repair protein RadA [Candidatus Gottesmanbacteria bacterium RIFCSPHIGHO2_02_FULL_40_13]